MTARFVPKMFYPLYAGVMIVFLLCGTVPFIRLLPPSDEIPDAGKDPDMGLVEHKTDSVPPESHFASTDDVTSYIITNTWSQIKVETFHIGSIVIDLKTGEVSIPEDMSISEASREFWKSVETMYPALFTKGEL